MNELIISITCPWSDCVVQKLERRFLEEGFSSTDGVRGEKPL